MSNARTALITGCSSGIGEATALRLKRTGWTVVATARRPESLRALGEAGCTTLALDVTDEASMTAAVEAVRREHGVLHALVNNAGYSQSGALETLTMAQLRRQFETNVFGLMRLTQLVLPGMREIGQGRIINIGSMGGRLTFPGGGAYHATKYALEALSDALRYEVGGFGIDVVLIQPGLIRTRFGDTASDSVDDVIGDGPYDAFNAAVARSTKEAYEGGMLNKLGGDPEDVAVVIQKALETKNPKARYRVTPSAALLMTQRSLMTDGMWDAFLRRQFPRPGS